MNKKIRITLGAAALLTIIFFPVYEQYVQGVLYVIFGIIGVFQDFSSLMSDFSIGYIIILIYLVAHLIWSVALPLLFLWSLYLIKPRRAKQRILYRIWLLFSLISSISLEGIPLDSFQTGDYTKIGYFLNPALLIVATGFEIWLWFTERRMKALE